MTDSLQHLGRTAGLLIGLCALSSNCFAQANDLQMHIDAASGNLAELDSMAQTCLGRLEAASPTASGQPCDDFLQAVDGELIADYLTHCKTLKAWREEFVNIAVATDVVADSVENLQLLVGIEFTCGENALRKRTQFVANAFSLLREEQIRERRAYASIGSRLSELEFEARQNKERQLLQNAIEQQRLNGEQATQRQFDDLANELIRQQINNQ